MTLLIDPAIGRMRLSESERKDIAKFHHDMRDKPYLASRMLGVPSEMFSFVEVWGPAAGQPQSLPPRQAPRGGQAGAVPAPYLPTERLLVPLSSTSSTT